MTIADQTGLGVPQSIADRDGVDVPPVGDRPRHPLRRLVLGLIADRRIRYLFVGGIAATVFYGTFAATWLLLGRWIPYLVIVLFGSVVTALTSYPIYRHLVFGTAAPLIAGFLRFYVVSLWGLGFNLAALPFLVEIVRLNVLISQAIVICAGPLINYQLHRHWTFRAARTAAAPPQPAPDR